MKSIEMNLSLKQLARMAGVFYLVIIVCGIGSGLLVRGAIIDYQNHAATLQNLLAGEGLYRLGFLGDTMMVIADVVVSVLFYFLLKHVHHGLAIFAALFRLLQSAVLGANLINLIKPVLMIQGFDTLDATQVSELENALMLQFHLFDYGYLISGVFFAFNCMLMGVLLYRSEIFPNALGVLLAFAGLAYLFNSLSYLVWPAGIEISEVIMLFTSVLAELGFCLYLLIKGNKKQKD